MKKVYISGGIQGIADHREIFKRAEITLIKNGSEVVNPCETPQEFCNCLTVEHTWECFLRNDIIELLKCDAIFMLPGWEKSRGARLEHFVALQCGLEVWGGNH
jgi:hypothetical protein